MFYKVWIEVKFIIIIILMDAQLLPRQNLSLFHSIAFSPLSKINEVYLCGLFLGSLFSSFDLCVCLSISITLS